MSVEAIFVGFGDITKTDQIQLLIPSAACCVDGKQDRHCHETADEADSYGNLEISKQQEAIERVVIEDIAVGNFVEGTDPVEETIGKLWRPFPLEESMSV